MMTCWNCGKSISVYDRYCTGCGVNVTHEGAPKLAPGLMELKSTMSEAALETLMKQPKSPTVAVHLLYLPKLSWAMLHAGYTLIPRLTVSNETSETLENLTLKAWITHFSEPFEKTLDTLKPNSAHTVKSIEIPIDVDRLEALNESRREYIRITLDYRNITLYSQTLPIDILTYWEWFFHPSVAQISACFVLPNTETVENITQYVRGDFHILTGLTNLDGYQSKDKHRVLSMVEAVYLSLRDRFHLCYMIPPGSFEVPQPLHDGTLVISQKVRSPYKILKQGCGTCLDITLFFASCLESIGLHPVIFLVKGHALPGFWIEETEFKKPVITRHQQAAEAIESGKLLPIDAIAVTRETKRPFYKAISDGKARLTHPETFECAVDIKMCRREGVKPLSET